jgi:hypothetical protein
MKVTEHISCLKGPRFSFEILPPTKGSSIQTIYDTLDPLMEFKPPYINITYHQAEVELKQRPDGLLEPRVVQKAARDGGDFCSNPEPIPDRRRTPSDLRRIYQGGDGGCTNRSALPGDP